MENSVNNHIDMMIVHTAICFRTKANCHSDIPRDKSLRLENSVNNKTIYICEDTLDGILTGVYDAWSSRKGHDMVKLRVRNAYANCESYELFCEYEEVQPDSEKALKVGNAVRTKICRRAYEMIARAALTTSIDKADMIYRFLVKGFLMGKHIVNHLTDPVVARIFELNRFVMNDAHFYQGMLRFEEYENKILVAKYEPQNNITDILSVHFADRFREENFIILDVTRSIAAIHRKRQDCIITTLSSDELSRLEESRTPEEEYKRLWITFFNTVSIEERRNEKLQQQNCRLHYRKYMTEFQ